MHRTLIAFYILLTSVMGMEAQERFAKIYDQGEWWASLITNVIPHDDGYTTFGICVDSTTRTRCLFSGQLDQNGELVLLNTLTDSLRQFSAFNPSLIFDDLKDEYQIVGRQVDANGLHVLYLRWRKNEWPPEEKLFDRLDIDGVDIQSSNYIRQNQYIYIYIYIYIASTLDGYDGRTDEETYLFKYDIEQDTVIWERNIGDSRWREIRSILHPISDSTFLIGFNRNDHHLTNNHFDYRMAIWKMDTSGQVLDRFELDIPDRLPGWPTDMVSTPDGGFIITGNIHTEVSFDAGRVSSDGYVFKLDENLDFVWGTEVKGDRLGVLSTVSRILPLSSDGEYIISGHLISYVPEDGAEWSEGLTFIAKINNDGEILWRQFFNFVEDVTAADEFHFNYDMRPTPDGGFILSGSFQDIKFGNNGKQRGYLIKVDSNGCLIPNCGINSTKDSEKSKVGLKIYPNPASDFLAFQIRSDITGS